MMDVKTFFEKINKTFDTVIVDQECTIKELLEKMKSKHDDRVAFVVDEDNKLCGVVSLGDLFRSYYAKSISRSKSFFPAVDILGNLTHTKVKDIMKQPVLSITMEDTIEDAVDKMLMEHAIKVLAVVDQEKHVLGAINILDIMQLELNGNDM